MISKVNEYEEVYSKFTNSYNRVYELEEPINEIENKIENLEEKKKKVDYLNPDVVVEYMQSYVNNQVAQKKKELTEEVINESNRLSNPNGKIHKNLEYISKWISKEEIKDIAKKSAKLEELVNFKETEDLGLFTAFSVLNKVLSYVFRFEFLKFFPKAVRIISALIVWGIILVPNMINTIYIHFVNQLSSLPSEQYEEAVIDFMDKFVKTCVVEISAVIILILAINIVVYYMVIYQAKKYVVRNGLDYYAVLDKKEFETDLYNRKIKEYTSTMIATWNAEIASIKKEGINEKNSSIPNSLYMLFKPELQKKYEKYNSEIENCKKRVDEIQEQISQAKDRIEQMIPEIDEKKREVSSFIKDTNHNEGILSPCVSVGFSVKEIEGVSDIVSIQHKYGPVLICYSDETANDIDRFKKNIEMLIEKLMISFFQENSHKILDLQLIDFEGLHFPASRTMGRMHVLHTQQELSSYYETLIEKRELIYSLPFGEGCINNINPRKLIKRENPIKYSVAFFVGVDFISQNKEIAQLYSVAENIGFVPFIFLRQSVASKLLNEEDKAFSRIIKRVNDLEQVYGFEDLVDELEYQVMISNQNVLLNQRVPVKTIYSMENFEKMAYSDQGFDFNGRVLYVDTQDLKESVYNDLRDEMSVKFFTLNGNIPDFIKSNVKRF